MKWIAFLGCAVIGFAQADRVTLRDGRELEGKVVREGDRVRLIGRFGESEFAAEDVLTVEKGPTTWERWVLARDAQRVGDLKQILELVDLALEQRVRSEVPKVLRFGVNMPQIDPADPNLLAVAALCRKYRLEELWIELLVRGARAQPAAADALRGLGYHLHRGAWLAADRYYPAIGYVRWEGSWYPPSQLPVLRAKRRLHAARGRVNGLREDEQRMGARQARARRRAGSATGRAAQAGADVATALDTLSVRERDLDRAQQLLAQAQAEQTSLAAQPLSCRPPRENASGPRAQEARERYRRAQRERNTQLERLQRRVRNSRDRVTQATRQREQTLCELESARERQAQHEGEARDAEAEVRRAREGLAAVPAALGAARVDLRQAENDLAAAERAARAEEADTK